MGLPSANIAAPKLEELIVVEVVPTKNTPPSVILALSALPPPLGPVKNFKFPPQFAVWSDSIFAT